MNITQSMNSNRGFTLVEVMISLFLILCALLFVGSANMTSLNLIGKGKINQTATLLLLNKIEELRIASMLAMKTGLQTEQSGDYEIQWEVTDHTPYFGTKQFKCRVIYQPAASVIVESIFYRSE